MQTAGSGLDLMSTAIFATLPLIASGHPGNLGWYMRSAWPNSDVALAIFHRIVTRPMSKKVANALVGLVRLSTAVMKRHDRARTQAFVSQGLVQTWPVETRYGSLKFYCPSGQSVKGPINFFRAEPETLSWIDSVIQDGEVLWDIGANVGVYALYVGLRPGVTVIAFEPSAQTFAVLVKNIEINELSERVHAYCVALDKTTRLGSFHMKHTAAGHAKHAFRQPEHVFGAFQPAFSQSMLAFSIDDFCRIFKSRQPDHIKLDVDSNETDILKGGVETLQTVKTILVEVVGKNNVRTDQGIVPFLESQGFTEDKNARSPTGNNKVFINKNVA